MAVLHKKGILKTGEYYIHESCTTGSIFKSRIIEEIQLGSIKGIIPEITGFAYLSSINNIVMDERDKLPFGFKVDLSMNKENNKLLEINNLDHRLEISEFVKCLKQRKEVRKIQIGCLFNKI